MRAEEFDDRLRRGAADVAAQTDPASAGAVRRRGDRRRHRNMAASGLLAFVIGAGGGGYAYASFTPATSSNVPSGGTSQSAPAAVSGASARPAIVAVTTAGEVVVLNSKTGIATSTLTGSQDVVGDEIAVTKSAVYFAVRPASSCADEIETVPLAGGTPAVVATGVLPAVSPDGTKLAYVKEQLDAPAQLGCTGGGPIEVVVRDLTTQAQTVYPAPPGEGAPVSHLSWSPGGKTLLVSAGPVQDNEGWTLSRLNLGTATYYLPPDTRTASKRYVQPGSGQPPGTYFAEGVYLPGGDLFVNQECCTGVPVKTTPGQLLKVSGSGVKLGRVAEGYAGWVNSSLDAVPGWLLYLSRTDLFIAADGQPAKALSNFGFVAAAWMP